MTKSDNILPLSTCSFDMPGRADLLPFDQIPGYRFVVTAKQVPPDGALGETVAVTANDAPCRRTPCPLSTATTRM